MSNFTNKDDLTVVVIGLQSFPISLVVDNKEYKVRSASVYDEIARNQLLENILSKLQDEGDIDEDRLLEIGVTQDELDSFCYDTSILDER